jgi:DNA repair protein RadC
MLKPPTPYRIKDIEESQRPRERLAKLGAEALSNAELIAILLRVGMKGANAVQISQRMLKKLGGLQGLHRAPFAQLCEVDGVGQAKAAQIKAAIEIGRRISELSPESRRVIASPQDAADLVQYEMMALEQEELWVLLLDSRNQLLAVDKLYKGSLNASSVRPAEIFKSGIRNNAAGLIVVHNHPSGDPSPSPEDISLTRILIEAGQLLAMPVFDHIVIGMNSMASIKAISPDLW